LLILNIQEFKTKPMKRKTVKNRRAKRLHKTEGGTISKYAAKKLAQHEGSTEKELKRISKALEKDEDGLYMNAPNYNECKQKQ